MRALEKINYEDVLFLDIETASLTKGLDINSPMFQSWSYTKRSTTENNDELLELYKKESALYAEFAKIICISIGTIKNGIFYTKTFRGEEKDLIKNFYSTCNTLEVNSKSKVYYCGHFIKGFDLPFIVKRGIINGMKPIPALDMSGKKPWELDNVLCTKELWQGTSFNRSSLITISTAFGYPSPKEDISGADVGKVYWNEGVKGLDRIVKYCERDVVATAQILHSMNCDEFNYEVKSLTEKVVIDTNGFKPLTSGYKGGLDLVDEQPKLIQLFNGGSFTAKDKKEMKALFDTLTDDEKEKARVILNGLVSSAKGKVTKIKKDFIKSL